MKTLEMPPPLPKDVKLLDVHNDEVLVPSEETTYWCKLVKFPSELTRKHHIISYESNVRRENVALVHHMEIFHCEIDSKIELPDWNGPCNSPEKPVILEACKKVIAAWAMGAEVSYDSFIECSLLIHFLALFLPQRSWCTNRGAKFLTLCCFRSPLQQP